MENRPSSPDPRTRLGERSGRVDASVLESAVGLLSEGRGARFALLAVGGYGRRELFPHSDVDLLLLTQAEEDARESKPAIAAFQQRLWDGGMQVSHSVRTVEECVQVHDGNVELNISLLDRRFLAGNRELYSSLEEKFPRFLRASRDVLVANLSRLTRDRYAKYSDTFYHLEPNVKETPGGLRDHHLIYWLECLRGNPWPEASPELARSFEHMARIRLWLHDHSTRDQNALTFDLQDAIAEDWNSGDAAGFMREYYRQSRAAYRAATRELESLEARTSGLLANFRDWRSRLGNADIAVRKDRAHVREPHLMQRDPELALRLFEFTARHGIPPSVETARRIEACLPAFDAHFGVERPLWPALSRLFALEHAPMALRAMHETGALYSFFPELKGIECQVIRDFYHRYTVDEHTIVAIETLRSPQGSYAGLLAEAGNVPAMILATLFHDAGKGEEGEGHVTGSVRLAEIAMERIGVSQPERELVVFLIGNHLVLSAVMQSRDVFDPETIREVVAQMGTVERLKGLTLLTYADISAVNPSAMTPWRAEQLWQLYLAAYNEITRTLESERIDSAVAIAAHAEFLEGLPIRYLRTHSEADVASHVALEEKSRKKGAAVEIERLDAAWQMTLVAKDRPGLFASAAGALAGFGLNILRAEAYTNSRGEALDAFVFADPLRNLDLNPSEVDRLRATAERVLSGRMDVKELLKGRPKPVLPSRKAHIPSTVNFNSSASKTATLIEIVAEDRPGLLYDVASTISSEGGNIEVVLIDTEAHKAIDVFYVTKDGRKLDAPEQDAMAEALRAALG